MTALRRAFIRFDRKTTLPRAAVALGAGVLFSALLFSALDALSGIPYWSTQVFAEFAFQVLPALVATAAVMIALIGGPGWAILHTLGVRSQLAATLYGAIATQGIWLLMAWAFWDEDTSIIELALTLAALAVYGGLTGWLIARVAYGKPSPAPNALSASPSSLQAFHSSVSSAPRPR